MKKLFTIVLAVTLMAFGSVAGAASIGVNMGSNEQSLGATDVAGVVVPQANWNNADWSGGSLSNVNNASGTPTTADVSWTAPGTWSVTANGTATGDAKMMYGYIDAQWGDMPAIVTLSDIPYALYDVYVYIGSNNQDHTGSVILNEGSTPTATYWFTNGANNPGGDGFQVADYLLATTTVDVEPYALANYAIFPGLTATSVTLTVRKGSENEGIFGVQIVTDPLVSRTKAWGPAPANNTTNIALNTDLLWYVPTDANTNAYTGWAYKVYFGTNSALAVPPITVGPHVGGNHLTVTNAQIDGPLSVGTYFWRVDSVDPNGPRTNTGDLWTFAAGCTLPTLIDPNNNYTEVVEIDVNLLWSSDPLAITHNVVITPDGGSPHTAVNKTSPYNPWSDLGEPAMAWNKQYTWQIIEKNAGGVTIATGPEWHFKVRALVCDGTMTADIDGSDDCIVNLADFAAMASQWLDCKWDDGGKNSPCP
jgi:hypothetical protein